MKLIWGMVALCGLCSCTPRYEAWRWDRSNGTTILFLQKNYSYATPLLIEIDAAPVAFADSGTLDVKNASYVGLAHVDFEKLPENGSESARYRHLDRDQFERFLMTAHFDDARPWRAGRPYLGTVAVSTQKGRISFNLTNGDPPSEFAGECEYRTLAKGQN